MPPNDAADDPTPVVPIPSDPSLRRATAGDITRLENMHGEHGRRLERVEKKQDETMSTLLPMNGTLQRLDAHVSRLVRDDVADTKVKIEVRKQGWKLFFRVLGAFLVVVAGALATLAVEHFIVK